MQFPEVAIILAAGVGSRLRPITNLKPKCLVRVAGRPILEYQISALREAGVRKVIVVVGYEAGQVKRVLAQIRGIECQVVVNADFEITNNSYSLYLARQALKDCSFLLANGDVVFGLETVQRICACRSSAAIAVDRSTFHWESMKVASDGNIVTDIAKTIGDADAYASSIDVYRFGAIEGEMLLSAITDLVEGTGNRSEWTETVMRRLVLEGTLRMTPVDVAGWPWFEIDNEADLIAADASFSLLPRSLPGISTALVDLDGTLYVGDTPVPGAADAIGRLRRQGIRVVFCSNNSSRSHAQCAGRLRLMGISCDDAEVVLSTDSSIIQLLSGGVRRAYVVGTEPLKQALLQAGIELTDVCPEIVVVGFDTGLVYSVLAQASRLISAGVPYILTHGDLHCPTETGPVPDAGAIGALLRASTGREPAAIFGKPHRSVFDEVENRFGPLDTSSTLVIGDRFGTDMRLASNIGCRSCLVLTGETKRADLEEALSWPDLVVGSISELVPLTARIADTYALPERRHLENGGFRIFEEDR